MAHGDGCPRVRADKDTACKVIATLLPIKMYSSLLLAFFFAISSSTQGLAVTPLFGLRSHSVREALVQGQIEEALEYYEDTAKALEEIRPDEEGLTRLYYNAAMAAYFSGRFQKAIDHGRKVLEISRRAEGWGAFQELYGFSVLIETYRDVGQYEKSHEYIERGFERQGSLKFMEGMGEGFLLGRQTLFEAGSALERAKLRQFRGERGCSLASWLRMVAARLTIDFLRKQKDPRVFMHEPPAANGTDPSTGLIHKEKEKMITDLISGLPAGDRLLIELSFKQELSAEDIAVILGITANALYTRKLLGLWRPIPGYVRLLALE